MKHPYRWGAGLALSLILSPAFAAKAAATPQSKTANAPSASSKAQTGLHSSLSLAGYQARDPNKQKTSDWIIALVNSEPITYQEMQARMVRIELQLQRAGQALPERDELEKQLLQKMIDDRAQVQEAKAMGLRIDEASVQSALQNMAAQSQLTDTQLLEKLRADGVSLTQLRNDLRDELLLDKIHEYQIGQVKVADSDLDAFIAAQKQAADEPDNESINLAQLLVAVPEGATDAKVAELRKKAEDLAQRAALQLGAADELGNPGDAEAGARGLAHHLEVVD